VFLFLNKKIPRSASEIGSVRTEAISSHVSDTKQFVETLSETPAETTQKQLFFSTLNDPNILPTTWVGQMTVPKAVFLCLLYSSIITGF
jgi:hypothetical protein